MLAAPLPTNADLDIEEAMDQVHYDSPFLTSRPSLVTPFEPRTRPPLTGTSAVKEPVADPEESEPSPAAVLAPRLSDLSKSPWSSSSGRQPASIMDVINAVNFEKKMAKKLHKNIQTRKRAAEAVSIVVKKAKRVSRSMTMNRRNGVTMDASQLEEELNNLSTNYISKLAQDHQTFVISIHSHMKVWWDAVMAVVTFYSIVVVPMDVCFDLSTAYDGVVSVQRTVEIVFVVDIILTFRTSYLSSVSLEEVVDVARIRQHYLTTWFWVDCLGSVPSDLFGTSCQQSQLAYLRLLVFLRILRLSTSPTFADLMSWASRTFTSYFVRLVVLTTMYLLLHHYIACSFYLLVFYERDATDRQWTVPFDANDTLDVKYVSSYYRGLLVTSGSDLGPVTSVEQIWGTAMFIVGILANACVAGICASVLAQMNKVEDEQVHQKECIHNTLRHCNAGEDLQKRVLTFFDSAHGRETAHHAAEMFHGMPEKLHFELSVALNQSFLDKVPLFRTLEPEGIVALMECVEETVAMSGDVIIRAGEEVADDVSYKRMWNVPLRASLVSTVSDVTQQVGVIHYLANKVLPKRMRIMLRKVRMRKAARRVMLLHHQQINRTQALSSRCQDNLHSNTSDHSQRSDTSHISHVPPRLVPDGTAPVPTGPDGMAIHAADTPSPSSIHSPPTAADPPVDAKPKTSPKGSRLKGAAKKMRASPLSNAHMLLSMLKGRQMSARALLAVTKMSQIAAKDMVDATSITKENMLYRANET
ncbi:hypothetical protein DYB37_004667 [Aphanomyces astaci]|uniref:Cyclic nucleotide-binding domain-containing protein n=1 Tax=Aphanomyces astaci TaxID=112090 RepID=A0A3R6WGT4_APHAT|nr:hypothetical protein DYB35_006235 [Aphanomyces astaci]RHZ17737.1 hypothetical protein DYB37_004667 [Aphanomyces astaci]